MIHCRDCRSAWESLARMDAALRALPLTTTDPAFTRSVMDRILAKQPLPFGFRLLEKLPYLFGLLIVLGVMVASFVMTGVIDTSELDRTKSVAGGLVNKAGETLDATISAVTAGLVHYLPFAFGKGSMSVAFFAVAVVIVLAAVDRLVGRKVFQK